MVAAAAYAIPPVELVLGVGIVLGLFLRPALIVAGIEIWAAALRKLPDSTVGHSRAPINLPPAFVSFDSRPAARPALNRRHASTVGFALLRDLNPSLPRDCRTYATTPVSFCM